MVQSARTSRSSSRAPAKARTTRTTTVAKAKPAAKAKAPVRATKVAAKPAMKRPNGAKVRAETATRALPADVRVVAPAPPLPKAEGLPPPAPPKVAAVVAKGYVPLVNIPPLPPPPKNLKLDVGDKIVHPLSGLGEILAIEHREIGGAKGEFFIIRILHNGMRLMVPRTSAQAAGLRPVMSSKEADKVLETMKAREVAVDLQPWSRRFRAYTEMIKSGSPHEVAKVLRDMYRLKFDKELSFGERRLLDDAKSLLLKELAAAKGVTEPALQARVDEMFRT
jgi:CarD family transcriptional regulator